jgi:preprotein translocase subunit SecF
MSKISQFGHALYQGKVSIDFVGRKWLWYSISGLILIAAISGLAFRGFNLGIEFKGGVEYSVAMPSGQANNASVQKIRDAVAAEAKSANIPEAGAPVVNTSGRDKIRVQTEPLNSDQSAKISTAIQRSVGVDRNAISSDAIGATWGAQVAERALLGLAVFLVLVVLFIWAYFREWKMSVGAIVALAHDLLITVGVYALSGFEVTPATVTGVLTILGFSLYDTVVVFDKVRENSKNLARSRRTYAEAANLAVNQTLVRSINTSVVALLPVGALLWVGVASLGSGALKDLALALFVGMAAGAYSSIFIATPLVVQLKELEPGVRAGDARALRHRARKDVDRYAAVPTFSEDMPLHDESGAEPEPGTQGGLDDRLDDGFDAAVAGDDREPAQTGASASRLHAPRPTAGERPASRSVSPSASAKRAQPSRKPRSQRGKK